MKITPFNFLILLILLVLLIPVILLALITSVPAMIWYALVVVNLGVIMLLTSYPWPKKVALGMLAMGVLISMAAFAVSTRYATTPEIRNPRGEILPGSITLLEKVRLGGTDQWITVRGKNKNNPVLLFLAGGPGGSELAWTRLHLAGLEDHFVVVNWDQPGAGKSYAAVAPTDLTLDRYLSDAVELVELMLARSGQSKMYVLGESWGSYLGVRLVQAHPEYFYAYIGSGQVVNFTENDRLGYQFALDYARKQGDVQMLRKLAANGPPPYQGRASYIKYLTYQNYLNTYMYGASTSQYSDQSRLMEIIAAPEYSLMDKVFWPHGLIELYAEFYPQLDGHDLMLEAPRLEVPVYFAHGRYDMEAMPALIEDYYARVDAPKKSLVWFENSGHTPLYEETGKFLSIVIEKALAETYPTR